MEYQYYAQRFRYLPDGRRVGTVNVGTILYIPDDLRPFSPPARMLRREPWRVEAWVPREVTEMDGIAKRYKTVRRAGGHLALIRSLRDSRQTKQVADWILLSCADAGMTR